MSAEIGIIVFFLSTIVGVVLYARTVNSESGFKEILLKIGGAEKPISPPRAYFFLLLVILYIIIVWVHFAGYQTLPGSNFYEIHLFLKSSFITQSFIGIVFGFILTDWLKYLFNSELLKQPHIRRAHTRWGIILVFLLCIGLLSESVRFYLENLTSISTPVASVSFQSVEGKSDPFVAHNSSADDAVSKKFAKLGRLNDLTIIPRQASRDLSYLEILYPQSGSKVTKNNISDFRELNSKLEEKYLNYFGDYFSCLILFQSEFTDKNLFYNIFSESFNVYRSYLKNTPISVGIDKLLEELEDSVQKMKSKLEANSIRIDKKYKFYYGKGKEEEHNCKSFLLKNDKNKELILDSGLSHRTPYAAIAFSSILSTAGSTEVAVKELSNWIDSKIDSIGLGKDQTPPWFVIRAFINLGILVEAWGHERALLDVTARSVDLIEHTFSRSNNPKIRSFSLWEKNCAREAALMNSLQFTYMTQVERLVDFSADFGDINEKILVYADTMRKVSKDCYGNLLLDGGTHYQSKFLSTYGKIMVKAADLSILQSGSAGTDSRERYRLAINALRLAHDLALSASNNEKAALIDAPLLEVISKERHAQRHLADIRRYLERAELGFRR